MSWCKKDITPSTETPDQHATYLIRIHNRHRSSIEIEWPVGYQLEERFQYRKYDLIINLTNAADRTLSSWRNGGTLKQNWDILLVWTRKVSIRKVPSLFPLLLAPITGNLAPPRTPRLGLQFNTPKWIRKLVRRNLRKKSQTFCAKYKQVKPMIYKSEKNID